MFKEWVHEHNTDTRRGYYPKNLIRMCMDVKALKTFFSVCTAMSIAVGTNHVCELAVELQ